MSETKTTDKPEVIKAVVEEYPRLLYKLVPKPKPPAPEEETEELRYFTVNSEEEEKKAEGEGWSKDVPKPKVDTITDKPQAKTTDGPHDLKPPLAPPPSSVPPNHKHEGKK